MTADLTDATDKRKSYKNERREDCEINQKEKK